MTRSPSPSGLLAAALSCGLLAVMVLVLLAVGCSRTPTGPGPACGACGVLTIPPPAQVTAAIRLGYDEALSTCPTLGPFESIPPPAVHWNACDFLARGGTVCAAGATYYDGGYIEVATAEQGRILPLVTWESRNWYWIAGGCSGQTV